MTSQQRIEGRQIGIVGMARSGVAAACLAQSLGGQPFVSDAKATSELSEATTVLARNGIPFETAGHSKRLLQCDYLVLSPGVPPTLEILRRASEHGLPMFSEIEFASWVCEGTIVAVTGSNGKTTTTTLLGEMFNAAGRKTFVCGNIGQPFAEVAADIPSDAIAVVEVSTFQLERIEDFKPHVAMILNLAPDHLDRHGTYEAYKQLKYRITENQTADDVLILNEHDRDSMTDKFESAARRVLFSGEASTNADAFVRDGYLCSRHEGEDIKIIACQEIGIPGPHNLQNAAAATCAARIMGVSVDSIGQTLANFKGVEHRLEMVDRVAGIDFVNDSKATNVDSVTYALRSIANPIHLIAGGRGKGATYVPIAEHGRERIKQIVLIGEARETMFDELGKEFPTQFADSLEAAVQICFKSAQPGETVLLSPACASFDMFDTYEHRGRVFKQAVAALRNDTTDATVED
jgi:UDP-N-acetylmuramoylalanine--D-glutamate ligase